MIHVDFLQDCIPNKRWPWPTVAHLTCDPTDDLDALHKFAAAIGLKRSWFQPRGGIMPHYDLTVGKRHQAIQAGAHELQTREAVVAVINAWRAFQAAKKSKQTDLFVA